MSAETDLQEARSLLIRVLQYVIPAAEIRQFLARTARTEPGALLVDSPALPIEPRERSAR